jgi:serine/threonine-protein kinase
MRIVGLLAVGFWLAGFGCSSSNNTSGSGSGGTRGKADANGTDGAQSKGGAPGSGGLSGSGGTTAPIGSGGRTGIGGTPGSGGGASLDGAIASGGATGTGGRASLDGAIASGGATGTGGRASLDGAIASGGRVGSGGRTGAGGTTVFDGATGSGGASSIDASIDANIDASLGTGGSADGGGTNASLPVGHCGARSGLYFPSTSWIYTDVSSAPIRSNSAATTTWLASNGGWGNNRLQIDTSFVILDADANTPRVARTSTDSMDYSTDCDPNVSMPIPAGGRIEGETGYVCGDRVNGNPDGDCHMLVADFSSNTLFEAYQATYAQSLFYTTCTIAWNMTRDVWGAPPTPASTLPPVATRNWGIGRGCTGPDAAGFPIAPLLFTIGDIQSGKIEHAIRFALPNNRIQKAAAAGNPSPVFVWPATHAGGPTAVSPDAPIYGSRWRLKANFDPTARGLDATNPVVRAVTYGLQHYGMLIADGGNIALMAEDGTGCSQTWDDLWGENGSHVLSGIQPGDFDVLDTGSTDSGYDCVRNTR